MASRLLSEWIAKCAQEPSGFDEFIYLTCNFNSKKEILQIAEKVVKLYYLKSQRQLINEYYNMYYAECINITFNYKKPIPKQLFKSDAIAKVKVNPKKDGKTIYLEQLFKFKKLLSHKIVHNEVNQMLHCRNNNLTFIRKQLAYNKNSNSSFQSTSDYTLEPLISTIKSNPYYQNVNESLKSKYFRYLKRPNISRNSCNFHRNSYQ